MSDTKAPSTPLSGVNPDQVSEKLRSNLACLQILTFCNYSNKVVILCYQMDKMVKRQAVTPGGLLMDIVLTPALKPGPK